ncbi:MAG: C4-dicarboxylate TRAP transporter substrate-binding protein [Enterocloster sp.]|nr:C4-dicarboxylate TRAP transporter substrate-binding protein [Enterocloster sp.]
MRKMLSVLLVVGMMVSLTACGGNSAGNTTAADTADVAETEQKKEVDAKPAVEGNAVKIQIGYEMNPGEPMDIACQKWKELIEEKSGGNMTVELFPSSQLGSKDDLMDQMIAGEAVITTGSAGYFADRGAPDMGITFGPYMFENWDQLDKVLASDWWKKQCGLLEENGLKVLTSWHFGERHTMTTKPVQSAADFKGMKIRVPGNKIQVKGFEILGAAPIPMALGEVYTSLQQGTIDGLENPLSTLYAGKYQEVAKYLILDGHIKDFTSWACGNTFFNSLTPEQQEILVSSAEEAGVLNNELAEKAHAEALENMKKEGVTVTEPDFEELREATKDFYELDDFKSIWSADLYDKIQGIINE